MPGHSWRSFRFSKGRHTHHGAMNDVVRRSLEAAKIPDRLEPSDIYRSDGKCPDRTSIVPWKNGRVLVWNVTCPDTLAPSYATLATRKAGAVAAEMERRKKEEGEISPSGPQPFLCSNNGGDIGSDRARGRPLL